MSFYKNQNKGKKFLDEENPNVNEFIEKDYSLNQDTTAFNSKAKEEYKKEFYDYLLSFYNNPVTIARHKSCVGIFINYCFEYNADFIRYPLKTLQGFLQNRKFNHHRKLSDNYINQMVYSLKKYYEYLYKMHKMIERKDLVEIWKIRKNKFKPVRKQVNITIDELDVIIKRAIKLSRTDEYKKKFYVVRKMSVPKIRAFLYFAFFTGLRLKEITDLQRKNVNMQTRIVEVTWTAKNLKKRYVPIPSDLCDILRAYFSIEPEKISCFNMTRQDIAGFFLFIKDIYPEKSLTLKDFRNSFATYMYYTCDIEESLLMTMLGHSSVQQTRAYLNKPNPKLYDDARRKIEEIVAKNNDIKINKKQRNKNAN